MLEAFLADKDFVGVRVDFNQHLDEADRFTDQEMTEGGELEFTKEHVTAAASSLSSRFLVLASRVEAPSAQASAPCVVRTRRESVGTGDEDVFLAALQAETDAKLAEFNLIAET